MIHKERGASTTEYGVAFALIVVVAILATNTLGINISSLFGREDAALHGSETQALFGLIGADVNGGPAKGLSKGGVNVTIDPATGEVIFSRYGASNATSSRGGGALIQMMSDNIRSLASRLPPGSNPQLQALLNQLASQGSDLADSQTWAEGNLDRLAALTSSGGKYSINNDVRPSLELLENRGNVADTYNQIMQIIGNDPKYGSLKSQLNDSVGVIQTTSWNNSSQDILTQMDMSRVPVTDILGMGTSYPNTVGELTNFYMQTGGNFTEIQKMGIAASQADSVGTPIVPGQSIAIAL